jgi:hypothetical protein
MCAQSKPIFEHILLEMMPLFNDIIFTKSVSGMTLSVQYLKSFDNVLYQDSSNAGDNGRFLPTDWLHSGVKRHPAATIGDTDILIAV